MGAPDSTCIESLYLELGITQISVIMKSRRINYLHYLLRFKENEMLNSVFTAQWKFPGKNDWTDQVQRDLKDFQIDLSLEEISNESEYSFKKLGEIKSKKFLLDQLLEAAQ